MRIVQPGAELLSVTPHAERLIEAAGRTCYKSTAADISLDCARRFVRGLVDRGHESVLEHASATFRITCDRGISHELVRHRIASFSQESTRYCNYGGGKFGGEIAVVEPPGLDASQHAAWLGTVQRAEMAYLKMAELGCSPQIARSVLPTCLKTELVMTANFREWRHVIRLRALGAAGVPHPQVVPIARSILEQLWREAPSAFEDLRDAG